MISEDSDSSENEASIETNKADIIGSQRSEKSVQLVKR